jgi:hypothetical protein
VELRFIDEFEHGIGWTPEGDKLQRASHALRSGDSVWLTDVVDGPGLDERIAGLGEPKGVIQLLDRHGRDCAAVATRLGVPLHKPPLANVDGAPFVVLPIVNRRFWREIAIWFDEERVLVCADALGSVGYFRTPDEPFGIHPLLRLFPPKRALGSLEPEHILFGHGPGYHGAEAPRMLSEALATSRQRLPRALRNATRS